MEKTVNVIKSIFLLAILLIFIIGGYILTKVMTRQTNEEVYTPIQEETYADIRVDKTKDYIYYDNESEVLESVDIIYRDAVFNLESMAEVNSVLKQENESIKQTIKYTKDVDEVSKDAEENEEGIYSLEYREYTDYSYGKYLSLVVNDNYYDIEKGVVAKDVKSYVVDKETGERISPDTLLSDNSLDMDTVKAKIKQRLIDTQTISDEEQAINIDETLNNLGQYALYINKTGKLAISFIVKTSNNNYNDSIELN